MLRLPIEDSSESAEHRAIIAEGSTGTGGGGIGGLQLVHRDRVHAVSNSGEQQDDSELPRYDVVARSHSGRPSE